MKADTKLLCIALHNQEWHTVAYLMTRLYGEYTEGNIHSSKGVFDDLIVRMPQPVLTIMLKESPFNCLTDLLVSLMMPEDMK